MARVMGKNVWLLVPVEEAMARAADSECEMSSS